MLLILPYSKNLSKNINQHKTNNHVIDIMRSYYHILIINPKI